MKSAKLGLALACLCCLLVPGAANAQSSRVYVSQTGDDSNNCLRLTPCKTFAGAVSKVAAGGEMDVLDSGNYGNFTATKSITVDGGSAIAAILASGTNGVVINDGGAGTAVVTLRNLSLEGYGFNTTGTASGVRGVWFVSGAALNIQRCLIKNFRDTTNGNGIAFTPSTNAKLFVEDTIVSGSGVAAGTGGIVILPTGAGSATVALERVDLLGNNLGIRAETTGGTGTGVFLTVKDSESSGNVNGGIIAFAQTGTPPVVVAIDRTTISHNGVGLNANGMASTMRIGNSVVVNNATGARLQNSATMTSYGTNQIADNPTAGSTLPIVGPS